jgi:uncharacterized protein (TIGR02217 family)
VTGLYSYPRRRYTLTYDLLREDSQSDWQLLEAFFHSLKGRATIFQFYDLRDNAVTDQSFGSGDGTSVAFQLVRSLGGYIEPVTMISGTPTIKIAGSTTAAYTLGATGLVTFDSPPAGAAALTWTGSYKWPCRFDNDSIDLENFAYQYWRVGSVSFTTEKLL